MSLRDLAIIPRKLIRGLGGVFQEETASVPRTLESHVYRRTVDIDRGDSLSLIARQIPKGSRVLELGVATGYFSRFMVEELQCTVDGVELSPAMAEEARPHCGKLLVADLEVTDLSEHFEAGAYDIIVCADVLEHVRDPAYVMKQLQNLLRKNGRILISIPNVAYAGLILDLLKGEFLYVSEGLLDRTHLRFYTRQSFLRLIDEVGLRVDNVQNVSLAYKNSEFADTVRNAESPLKEIVLALPDADVYQYIVSAY